MMQYCFTTSTKQGARTDVKAFQKQQKRDALAAILDEMMQDAETVSVSVHQLDKRGNAMFIMSDTKLDWLSRHYDAELAKEAR